MAEPLDAYMEEMRNGLSGKLPREQIESIVSESQSHVSEIQEQLAKDPLLTEREAIRRFGPADRLVRSLLRSRRFQESPWKAALVPLLIMLVGLCFLDALDLSTLRERPYVAGFPLMYFLFGAACI